MKICLKNIRSHKGFGAELPSTGLVRIKGPSGVGKSNIFKAMDWGLYGKVQNIARYGATSCSVEISGQGWPTVVRAKGPNLLSVDGFTNDTAQKLIESAIKMNHAEFMVSSYVMQDQKNSLLSIAPAQQLELIQSLSSKSGDPEEVKARLEEEEDTLNKQISDISSEMRVLESSLETNANTISLIKKQLEGRTSGDLRQLTISRCELHREILNIDDRLKVLRDSLAEKRSIRDNADRKAYFKAVQSISTLQSRATDLTSEIAELQSKTNLDEISGNKGELEGLKAVHSELCGKELFYKNVQKARAEQDKAQLAIDELWLRMVPLPESPLTCPVSKLEAFSLDLSELIELRKIQDKAVSKEEVSDPSNEKHEVERKMSDLKASVSLAESALSVLDNKKVELSRVTSSIDAASHTLSGENYVTDEEINLAIDEVTASGTEMARFQSNLKTEFSNVQEKISECEHVESQKVLLEQHRRIDVEKSDALLNCKLSHDAMQARLAKVLRLKELAKKASLDSIEAIVEEINLFAEYWVRTMFGGSMKAYLKTSKELKTKKTAVSQISLHIEENGVAIDKKEELSGGQQSRLCLAFQLALSDMYDSPILMLDEAFKGLDANTMATCLAAVKQISERKLVLVSEHFAEDELFDQTIEV